jgi:hypothetical protein
MNFHPPVSIEGSDENPETEYIHKGLADSASLKIMLVSVFDADMDIGEPLTIEIAPFRNSLSGPSEKPLTVDLSFSLPDNWEFIPMSISPGGIGNYLSLDKNTIEMNSDDPGNLDLISNGIKLEIRYDPEEEDPGNDSVEYEDVPVWFYVVITAGIIGIVFLIFKFITRREKPPEDY